MSQPIFLINVGHPRTGTGYTMKLYQSLGYKIGHERIEKDGISDWAFSFDNYSSWCSPHLTFESFSPQYITYNVRDPWTSIAAIKSEVQSLNKRKQVIDFGDYQGFNLAVWSLLSFDKQIRENRKVDTIIRIEFAEKDIEKLPFLDSENLEEYRKKVPKEVFNARHHPGMTLEDWKSIDDDLINLLDEYCDRYDYPKISKRIKEFEELTN